MKTVPRLALAALFVLAFAFCFFAVLTLTARAQEATQAQTAQIQETIADQIRAFQADDLERAYGFASPTIHQMFPSAESFGRMVREGYPMVWRPSDVAMMELRFIGGAFWQRLRVTDGAGQAFLLDYQMIEGPDGWRINAVHLQKAPDIGA